MAGLRITATPEDGGQAWVIADGENARGPGGRMAVDVSGDAFLVFTFGASIERDVPGLRADGTRNFDRKNETAKIPCRVEYEFTSEGAAFAFACDIQKSVPRVADVTFSLDGVSRVAPNVALRDLTVRLRGVLVVVDYPITFGLLATPAQA